MTLRNVFCIGETVLDIIFRGDVPVAARPGGSMLNSAVSLGRAGVPVHLITDFGSDHTGGLVYRFLRENNVSTDYVDRYYDGKTALALAFLDDQQNAEYTFYKDFPQVRLQIPMPDIQQDDIILFGSFYALTASIRETLIALIRLAKSRGAFILYDPNFRRPHHAGLDLLKPWIIENISLASLVRGSDEDFRLIFDANTGTEAFRHIQQAGCPMLIYTKNRDGVEMHTPDNHLALPVTPIDPVSTIGAGDAFNAGVIYALPGKPAATPNLPERDWENILQSGIRFSENVCLSLDNYISIEFGRALNQL